MHDHETPSAAMMRDLDRIERVFAGQKGLGRNALAAIVPAARERVEQALAAHGPDDLRAGGITEAFAAELLVAAAAELGSRPRALEPLLTALDRLGTVRASRWPARRSDVRLLPPCLRPSPWRWR